MRERLTLLMVALAAMVVTLGCQKGPKAPPRGFTNSLGMRFVWIQPGSFKMGWEGQGPVHDVTLSRGSYLQATEVTQAQWKAVMGTDPSHSKGPERPVEMVSWNDIQEFLRKLNAREKGARYRLPTEAEWEYACRVGGQEPDAPPKLDDAAWWIENFGNETRPVSQTKPNRWGLYDMRGNVSEWVQDWDGPYPADRQIDPQGPSSGTYRIVRGGSWSPILLEPDNFRCAHRSGGYELDRRNIYFGFRCARSL